MNGSFKAQIFVDKLAKLNNSQQSIETLSHWCIFHRIKARQVVETWENQFYSAPRDRRVSFLYLANDIMQNSRKKGQEFITEFWRVLPAALNDVLKNGDEFGRNAVIRLVDIWDERKLFGSHGQILKEELFRRNKEHRNIRDDKGISYKVRQPGGEMLDKVISCYKHICNAPVHEDTLLGQCQVAVSFVDKIEKEFENNSYLGSDSGSEVVGELQVQHGVLRNSIEQLKASESVRTALISHLREALHEQEVKMEQVRNQLQVAQSRYEQADALCQKLGIYVSRQPATTQGLNDPSLSEIPTFIPESSTSFLEKGQSAAAMYSQEGEGGECKTTAANVVAKLTACPASHEILSGVFSSLVTRDNVDQKIEEHDNKRQKLENDIYVPQHQSLPPPPPFPHPDTFQQPPPPPQQPPSPESSPPPPPPPPPMSMPPPIPPPPPPATSTFMPVPAGPMTGMPYGAFPSFTPLPNFPMMNMPPPFPGAPNPYPGFQGSENALFSPPFSSAPPTMNRQ